jgi:uncharacterized protein
MKVLLWVLVAFAVGMWLTYGKKKKVAASRADRAAHPAGATEEMVRCAHCGTYIPASESITLQPGLSFCSEEHRQLHSSPDRRA